LWKKGILHRDISINNILLGKEDAEPGNRGLVIDLDMAIWIDRTTSLAGADFRTVRFFRLMIFALSDTVA
jgi:serine/threonine protein kinase